MPLRLLPRFRERIASLWQTSSPHGIACPHKLHRGARILGLQPNPFQRPMPSSDDEAELPATNSGSDDGTRRKPPAPNPGPGRKAGAATFATHRSVTCQVTKHSDGIAMWGEVNAVAPRQTSLLTLRLSSYYESVDFAVCEYELRLGSFFQLMSRCGGRVFV